MSFKNVARELQSRFRDTSVTISQVARNPEDEAGQRYGHFLALGSEEENLAPSLRGNKGACRFFEDRRIKWWKSSTPGFDCANNRPTRNLLSSQVACVNFMMPLASEPTMLANVLRGIDPDVQAIEPIRHDGRQACVEFEWTGDPPLEVKASGGRGHNVTSADALVLTQADGGRRAYLIEWKYTESYAPGQSKSNDVRTARYSGPMEESDSSFREGVNLEAWMFEPYYQIMRLRLLADRMVRKRELDVSDARVLVVCPRSNSAYRDTVTSRDLQLRYPDAKGIEDVVRRSLRRPDGFRLVAPEDMIASIYSTSISGDLEAWRAYLWERYSW